MAHQSMISRSPLRRNRREQRQSDDKALENSNGACCGVVHGYRFWRIYVPKAQVLTIAQQAGGTPCDIDAVEFTHEGRALLVPCVSTKSGIRP